MGRGQLSAGDQFSKVLGPRRGSALAQKERDREEAFVLIDEDLAVENTLDFEHTLPLVPLLNAQDKSVEERITAAIKENIRHNGLRTLLGTLSSADPEIPQALCKLMRSIAAEHIAADTDTDPSVKRDSIVSLVEDLFTTQPFRPMSALKADLPLIKAIASYYKREVEINNDPHGQLFRLLGTSIAVQPPDYLPLFCSKPSRAMIMVLPP